MQAWQNELMAIVDGLLIGFSSPIEQYAVGGLALLVAYVTLLLGSRLCGAAMATPARALLALLLGGAALATAVIATRLYLMPRLHATPLTQWVPLVLAGLVLLLVILPLIGRILVIRYFETCCAVIFTLFAAAGVVLLAQYALSAFHTGDRGFDRTRARRDGINSVIEDHR